MSHKGSAMTDSRLQESELNFIFEEKNDKDTSLWCSVAGRPVWFVRKLI